MNEISELFETGPGIDKITDVMNAVFKEAQEKGVLTISVPVLVPAQYIEISFVVAGPLDD